jgi:hypothetical protein
VADFPTNINRRAEHPNLAYLSHVAHLLSYRKIFLVHPEVAFPIGRFFFRSDFNPEILFCFPISLSALDLRKHFEIFQDFSGIWPPLLINMGSIKETIARSRVESSAARTHHYRDEEHGGSALKLDPPYLQGRRIEIGNQPCGKRFFSNHDGRGEETGRQ